MKKDNMPLIAGGIVIGVFALVIGTVAIGVANTPTETTSQKIERVCTQEYQGEPEDITNCRLQEMVRVLSQREAAQAQDVSRQVGD